MRYNSFRYLSQSVIGTLAVSLVGFSGCAQTAFVAPELETLLPPPTEVTAEQLYADYMTDEAAADARYKGKRISFTGVVVEEVYNSYDDPKVMFVNMFIMSGSVKFKPMNARDFDAIKEGFVVDIVGEC